MFSHTHEAKSITDHVDALRWLHARGFTTMRTEPGEYRLFKDDELVGEASLATGSLVVMTQSPLTEESTCGPRYLQAALPNAPVMLVIAEYADKFGRTSSYTCIWFTESGTVQELGINTRDIDAGAFIWATANGRDLD